MEAEGKVAPVLGDMDKVLANGSGGSYVFGPTLLRDNRRAGVAFMRALLKATREDLQGNFLKNKQTVRILAKATGSFSWVVEASNGFRFTLEEAYGIFGCLAIGIGGCFGTGDFDGYLLIDTRIFRQIHLTHAAASQQAQDAIVVNLLSFQ